MSVADVTTAVLGDIAVILLVSTLLGGLARRFGQPAVIGQILTGVVLGPTLLGRFPGNPTGRLFPAAALPYLSVLSQVAIVTFMFVVGYELRLRSLRESGRTTLSVGAVALLVPMLLGAGAVTLVPSAFSSVGEHHVDSRPFVLFMAVTVSITALPVLAAIIRDTGIAGTRAGVVALSAAGLMDIGAWTVLAMAMPGASHGPPLWRTVLLTLVLVLGGLLVVRPLLSRWLDRPRGLFVPQLPVAIVLATSCAWATSELGLHAVFGGFLAGLVMPRRGGAPDADVLRAMEGATDLLLPLFFVVTGLSLDIGALDPGSVPLLGLLLLIAIVGKTVPGYLMSRLNRLGRRESATIAVLLNTRGLTELIALNVGLSAGIIHGRLFTLLVLVALVTTAMTSPLLTLLARPRRPASRTGDTVPSVGGKEA
ncbi:cation:proton antiporter [Streptomyces sp. NPDC093018]|uniref:cation:proton antiporter n=1 Tax=Streptomyces sp. NPDC093018 TaxID=3155067 RepID=UPI00341D84A7